MPFVAAAAIIGGTLLQAKAESKEAKQAQKIANINARNLEVKADQEEEITREEIRDLNKEKRRQISRLRVLGGLAGIDAIGTPLLQAEEIAGEFSREKQFTAKGGRIRSFDLRTEAGLERFRGKQIRRASRFRTGTTIATGAFQAGSLLS